jgi:hypothetical protein
MKILVVYDQYQTYTNAVFEYLNAFKLYSKHQHYFVHYNKSFKIGDLDYFDAIVIHFSVRLPFGCLSNFWERALHGYCGQKILFLQDEYDKTAITIGLIKKLAFDLVFTVVPPQSLVEVYDQNVFRSTKFVSCLTGYVSQQNMDQDSLPKIGERQRDVGYRGRALPFWYGDLGQEKHYIAKKFDEFGSTYGLIIDVSSSEQDRIYGDEWVSFLKGSKVTLGTESGSNIFDHHGQIKEKVQRYILENPNANFEDVKEKIFKNKNERPIMNQISPRIFEAINLKTGLVLFEGNYSGIILPEIHYIPLKKDFSNIQEVINKIKDIDLLQEMVDRAYRDVIMSKKYDYKNFIHVYDGELDNLNVAASNSKYAVCKKPAKITEFPNRVKHIKISKTLRFFWDMLPVNYKSTLKSFVQSAQIGKRG